MYDPGYNVTARSELFAPFTQFVLETYGVERDSPELLSSLINDAAEYGVHDEIIDDHIESIEDDNIRAFVLEGLKEVRNRADRQADELIAEVEASHPGLSGHRKLLAAVDLMAERAYGDKVRKSGEPYRRHPKRATALEHHILSEVETKTGEPIEINLRTALLAATDLHDGTEENMKSCKYYSGQKRPDSFMPLTVRYLFDKLGNPYGPEVANALRLMTHHVDHPWAPSYREYIMIGSSSLLVCIPKTMDQDDNLYTEPKPKAGRTPEDIAKIDRKENDYRWSRHFLHHTAPLISPQQAKWINAFYNDLFDIRPENRQEIVAAALAEYQDYVYQSPN